MSCTKVAMIFYDMCCEENPQAMKNTFRKEFHFELQKQKSRDTRGFYSSSKFHWTRSLLDRGIPRSFPMLTFRVSLCKCVSRHRYNCEFVIRFRISSTGSLMCLQEGSGDLQEGHPSVTKGASPSAKHPLKVPFTKA